MRLRSEDKHHLRKSADRKEQIRKAFVPLNGLNCAFRSADFLRWCLSSERNLTHNLFLFPIVFGVKLIRFLMRRRTVQEIRSFVSVLRSPVTPFDRSKRRTRTVSKTRTILATESVNSAPFKRGESKVQFYGKEKCKTLRHY